MLRWGWTQAATAGMDKVVSMTSNDTHTHTHTLHEYCKQGLAKGKVTVDSMREHVLQHITNVLAITTSLQGSGSYKAAKLNV